MNPATQPAPVNPNIQTGMTQGQIQAQIEKNRAAMGEQVANIPQIQQQYSPSTDATIGALRQQQNDKLQQLFAHDTQLAQTYFPVQNAPGPSTGEVPMPANNQMIVDPSIGLRAASGQTLSTAKEMGDIATDIAKRKDVLTEGLNKALQLLEFGLKAKQMENDALKEESGMNQTSFENLISVLSKSGGTIPSDIGSQFGIPEGTRIPGEAELKLLGLQNTQEGRKLQSSQGIINDITKNGLNLQQIISKYRSSGLTGNEIMDAVDTATNQMGWGAHKESTQQLRSMGLSDYNPPKGTQLTTKEIADVGSSSDAISIIDDTINRLKNIQSSDLGPGKGNVYSGLFKIGAGGVLPEDVRVVGQNLIKLQGMGDKSIMGGRLIRDLVGLFGPSFPSLNYTKEQNLTNLVAMRNKLVNQLNVAAQNKYYNSVNDIPGLEDIDANKYVVVQDRKTGQIGKIPESEFDSKLYKKL